MLTHSKISSTCMGCLSKINRMDLPLFNSNHSNISCRTKTSNSTPFPSHSRPWIPRLHKTKWWQLCSKRPKYNRRRGSLACRRTSLNLRRTSWGSFTHWSSNFRCSRCPSSLKSRALRKVLPCSRSRIRPWRRGPLPACPNTITLAIIIITRFSSWQRPMPTRTPSTAAPHRIRTSRRTPPSTAGTANDRWRARTSRPSNSARCQGTSSSSRASSCRAGNRSSVKGSSRANTRPWRSSGWGRRAMSSTPTSVMPPPDISLAFSFSDQISSFRSGNRERVTESAHVGKDIDVLLLVDSILLYFLLLCFPFYDSLPNCISWCKKTVFTSRFCRWQVRSHQHMALWNLKVRDTPSVFCLKLPWTFYQKDTKAYPLHVNALK